MAPRRSPGHPRPGRRGDRDRRKKRLDIAARIGHAEWTAAAHRGLGIACEAAGLPGRAESAYRRSLEAAEGIPLFRAWAAARLGAFLARQGRPGEAAPHVQAALAGGTPLTRHEARWAHAELLASQGDDEACRAAAATALDQARDDGYLVLVPRLRELADADTRATRLCPPANRKQHRVPPDSVSTRYAAGPDRA